MIRFKPCKCFSDENVDIGTTGSFFEAIIEIFELDNVIISEVILYDLK